MEIKQNKKRGFTFIEMVLVASLISLTGLAVYQSLSNGIKIWNRSQRFVVEEDIAILFDKMQQDFSNAFYFSRIEFKGSTTHVTFPTIVRIKEDEIDSGGKVKYGSHVGHVQYYLDKNKKILYRKQGNYGQSINNKFDKPRALASSIYSLFFSYYVIQGNDMLTVNSWSEEDPGIPVAILVEIEHYEDSGKIRKIKRLFNIPAG